MKMSLKDWKVWMRALIDGLEASLSAADAAPQIAKLTALRKQLDGPTVARHRKRLEEALDALVESDVALQIASRRCLRPRVQEAMQKALVTMERANRVLAQAAQMRMHSGKKRRGRRGAAR